MKCVRCIAAWPVAEGTQWQQDPRKGAGGGRAAGRAIRGGDGVIFPSTVDATAFGATTIIVVEDIGTRPASVSVEIEWPEYFVSGREFASLPVCAVVTFDAAPVWGWWAAYYPDHPVLLPRDRRYAARPHRAQARACRIDRNRWKRRRFIQRLRRRVMA